MPAPDGVCVSVAVSSSESESRAALTRTCRGVFQFAPLNVSDVGLTVMPPPAPVIVTVTLPPIGRVRSFTV